jgi:hypothetical protein
LDPDSGPSCTAVSGVAACLAEDNGDALNNVVLGEQLTKGVPNLFPLIGAPRHAYSASSLALLS